MLVMKEMGCKIHEACYNENRKINRLLPPMPAKQVTVLALPKRQGTVVDGIPRAFR